MMNGYSGEMDVSTFGFVVGLMCTVVVC